MKPAARQTRAFLMDLFERHGFYPRHDLGQNFLIDLNLLDVIVKAAELSRDDVVLEVGAGTGGLTTHMAVEAGHVVSVEYDNNMFKLVSEHAGVFPNVTLLNCDALRNKNHLANDVLAEIQKQLAAEPNRSLKFVANLPYNIATPLISNLIATELPWTKIVVMVQLELAERMAASPHIANYNGLSVWVQSQADVKIIRRIPPTVFWPRPDVNSAIISITARPDLRGLIKDRKFFQNYIRMVFTQRRKLLRKVTVGVLGNDLSKVEIDAAFEAEGLTLTTRAEELFPAQLVSLSNRLRDAILRRDESGG